LIQFTNRETLVGRIRDVVKQEVTNAIYCMYWHSYKTDLWKSFLERHSDILKKIVNDIYNKDEQREIVTIEHNRAHRAAQENVKQILQN